MLIEHISIYDFVCALSKAIDLISPVLNNHHAKTAYASYSIAREMQLPHDEMQEIILAAMLHDIGAFPAEERVKILTLKSFDYKNNRHALLGYELLKGFAPLTKVASLIKHHHSNYDKSRDDILFGSYIIRLADRIAALINERQDILKQAPEITKKILQKQLLFHPGTVEAFNRLTDREYFWIELASPSLGDERLQTLRFSKEIIDLETLRNFAKVVAQLIDFRSRFTATHSSGVAAVAKELAAIARFSERECKLMEIAGFLHDLGKLAVPNEILEKNGALNDDERNYVRKHTYYTYHIMRKISGLRQIAAWAAFHHERLNGNGYPFHVKGEDFPKLARIMAVADNMTALTEDRPYRLGIEKEKAKLILLDKAKNGHIDHDVVELLNKNFGLINDVRIKAQLNAQKEYETFYTATRKTIKKKMY